MKIKMQLLTISLLCLCLFSCAGTKSIKTGKIFAEPEYKLSAIRFIEVDMERLGLEIDLLVTNPNYLGLEFQNVNYELQVDEVRVLTGSLKSNLKVPAKESVVVTIPLDIQMQNLASGAVSLMINRTIEYVFQANLNSTIPILSKKTFKVQKAEILNF